MPSDLMIAVVGETMALRACRLHPEVFSVHGECPLCQWQRLRRDPWLSDRGVTRRPLRLVRR